MFSLPLFPFKTSSFSVWLSSVSSFSSISLMNSSSSKSSLFLSSLVRSDPVRSGFSGLMMKSGGPRSREPLPSIVTSSSSSSSSSWSTNRFEPEWSGLLKPEWSGLLKPEWSGSLKAEWCGSVDRIKPECSGSLSSSTVNCN